MANVSYKIHALGTQKVGADGKMEDCKGTLSVYGLQRFPISMHAEQWLELLTRGPALIAVVKQALKDGTMATKAANPKTPAGGKVAI